MAGFELMETLSLLAATKSSLGALSSAKRNHVHGRSCCHHTDHKRLGEFWSLASPADRKSSSLIDLSFLCNTLRQIGFPSAFLSESLDTRRREWPKRVVATIPPPLYAAREILALLRFEVEVTTVQYSTKEFGETRVICKRPSKVDLGPGILQGPGEGCLPPGKSLNVVCQESLGEFSGSTLDSLSGDDRLKNIYVNITLTVSDESPSSERAVVYRNSQVVLMWEFPLSELYGEIVEHNFQPALKQVGESFTRDLHAVTKGKVTSDGLQNFWGARLDCWCSKDGKSKGSCGKAPKEKKGGACDGRPKVSVDYIPGRDIYSLRSFSVTLSWGQIDRHLFHDVKNVKMVSPSAHERVLRTGLAIFSSQEALESGVNELCVTDSTASWPSLLNASNPETRVKLEDILQAGEAAPSISEAVKWSVDEYLTAADLRLSPLAPAASNPSLESDDSTSATSMPLANKPKAPIAKEKDDSKDDVEGVNPFGTGALEHVSREYDALEKRLLELHRKDRALEARLREIDGALAAIESRIFPAAGIVNSAGTPLLDSHKCLEGKAGLLGESSGTVQLPTGSSYFVRVYELTVGTDAYHRHRKSTSVIREKAEKQHQQQSSSSPAGTSAVAACGSSSGSGSASCAASKEGVAQALAAAGGDGIVDAEVALGAQCRREAVKVHCRNWSREMLHAKTNQQPKGKRVIAGYAQSWLDPWLGVAKVQGELMDAALRYLELDSERSDVDAEAARCKDALHWFREQESRRRQLLDSGVVLIASTAAAVFLHKLMDCQSAHADRVLHDLLQEEEAQAKSEKKKGKKASSSAKLKKNAEVERESPAVSSGKEEHAVLPAPVPTQKPAKAGKMVKHNPKGPDAGNGNPALVQRSIENPASTPSAVTTRPGQTKAAAVAPSSSQATLQKSDPCEDSVSTPEQPRRSNREARNLPTVCHPSQPRPPDPSPSTPEPSTPPAKATGSSKKASQHKADAFFVERSLAEEAVVATGSAVSSMDASAGAWSDESGRSTPSPPRQRAAHMGERVDVQPQSQLEELQQNWASLKVSHGKLQAAQSRAEADARQAKEALEVALGELSQRDAALQAAYQQIAAFQVLLEQQQQQLEASERGRREAERNVRLLGGDQEQLRSLRYNELEFIEATLKAALERTIATRICATQSWSLLRCMICNAAEATLVFAPCGHKACPNCGSHCEACANCGSHVEKRDVL